MLSHWHYKYPSYCQKCESFLACIPPLCLSIKRLQPAAHVALSANSQSRKTALPQGRNQIHRCPRDHSVYKAPQSLLAYMSYDWQNLKNTGENQFALFLSNNLKLNCVIFRLQVPQTLPPSAIKFRSYVIFNNKPLRTDLLWDVTFLINGICFCWSLHYFFYIIF